MIRTQTSIERMRGQVKQREARGNPPNEEASFNVLDLNPLENITNSKKIAAVYLRGKQVDRKALRAGFITPLPKRTTQNQQ